jgi:hypothetical protein
MSHHFNWRFLFLMSVWAMSTVHFWNVQAMITVKRAWSVHGGNLETYPASKLCNAVHVSESSSHCETIACRWTFADAWLVIFRWCWHGRQTQKFFLGSSAGGNEPRREISVHELIMNKGSCNKQLDFIYFFNRQLQEHDNDVTRS